MVTILPPKTSIGSQIGQSFGQGLSRTMEEQYQRGQLQSALNRLRTQGQNPNATPTDLLYNLIEASSYSPEIGRNLPQLYAELNKAREANAMKNVNFGGDNQSAGVGQPSFQGGGISRQPKEPSPELQKAIQGSKFFPSNVGSQESPGNLPQETTSGRIRPILSGKELFPAAQRRQTEYARNGIIKSFPEVLQEVKLENEEDKLYNQQVNLETEQRIESQKRYGKLAEDRLTKLFPNASDRVKSVFRQIAEKAAGENRSEGEIDQFITDEVNKYKDTLSNIENNLEAPRIQNRLRRAVEGKSSDLKVAMQDAKQSIQPILKLGLFEEARTYLANAGFYPEERETIIFGEMPKQLKEIVDSIPKPEYQKREPAQITSIPGIPSGKSTELPKEYDLITRLHLFDSLSKVWEENPQVNLLQLRKAYEDKGYDWRIFKDALNELKDSGHIQLTDDQERAFNSYLNNPPLNKIGQFLHGLNIIGR